MAWQVVESCSRILGALASQRLATIAARFLKELCDSTATAGKVSRLKSDLPTPRQEIFQICRGMRHVRLSLRTDAEVMFPTLHLSEPAKQAQHHGCMQHSRIALHRAHAGRKGRDGLDWP